MSKFKNSNPYTLALIGLLLMALAFSLLEKGADWVPGILFAAAGLTEGWAIGQLLQGGKAPIEESDEH